MRPTEAGRIQCVVILRGPLHATGETRPTERVIGATRRAYKESNVATMLTDSGVPAFSQGLGFPPSSGPWMPRNYQRGKSCPQFGIPRALEPPPRTATVTTLAVKLDVNNSTVGSATGEADFNTIRRSLFPRKPD